jgi:hypothetical protein
MKSVQSLQKIIASTEQTRNAAAAKMREKSLSLWRAGHREESESLDEKIKQWDALTKKTVDGIQAQITEITAAQDAAAQRAESERAAKEERIKAMTLATWQASGGSVEMFEANWPSIRAKQLTEAVIARQAPTRPQTAW